MKRDILSILDLPDIREVLARAATLKAGQGTGRELAGMSLAMIFEKSSTRTRVSFEVAMTQLGGHAIFLNQKDSQLGRGETIPDTARVLGRYADAIMYRAFSHANMAELARFSSVPVINALDDLEHPCQIAADLLTVQEHKGRLEGLKLAYVGDGNNVCNSLLLGAAMVGMHAAAACPPGYQPNAGLAAKAKELAAASGVRSEVLTDPVKAVEGADIVYTDTWVSMGQEEEVAQRRKTFLPYQVNGALMAKAKEDAIFMHCLPAHRGWEVTDEVMEGPHSVVFDQAENRLHAQKAILLAVLNR